MSNLDNSKSAVWKSIMKHKARRGPVLAAWSRGMIQSGPGRVFYSINAIDQD